MTARKNFNELTSSQQKETAFYLIDKNFNSNANGCYTSSLFDCPITRELINSPVITSSGNNYEMSAISSWLTMHESEPLTRVKTNPTEQYPNHLFKLITVFLSLNTADSIKELIPALSSFLRDPLSGEFFKEPVVARDGNTYEKNHLINLASSDPYAEFLCRRPLYPHFFLRNLLSINAIQQFTQNQQGNHLTPTGNIQNKLLISLTEHFHYLQTQSQQDLSSLQAFLHCPLSGKPFVKPVLAANGETYEHSALLLRAKKDEQYFKLANKPLQTNYFALNFLQLKEWIFIKPEPDASLSCQLSHPIIQYMAQRKTEHQYHYGLSFKLNKFFSLGKIFSRDEKLFSASSIICGLFHKEQARWLLNDNNTALPPAKEGRLEKAAEPALIQLGKTRSLNKSNTPLYYK